MIVSQLPVSFGYAKKNQSLHSIQLMKLYELQQGQGSSGFEL